MTGDATLGRRELGVVALLWAALAATFVFINLDSILLMNLPDADDYLRLQQVRDWLGGQAWFDVAQHRVNPPTGGALHWSRVVDMPLAAGIALLTPLIGQANAEMAVAAAMPLILMGLAMLLAAAITARLVGRAWACVAALAIPLSAITYPQIMPLRIDHHAWQVVLALTMLWALTDETHKRRSGAVAGVAAAFWLNISIEGLPIVTCAALILGVRWLLDARELPRLQAYLWALTLGGAALETATMPSAWSVVECDRISQPYLAAFAVASVAAAAARLPALAQHWRFRLIFAGAAGAAVAIAFAGVGPQCLGGPFGNLDPLTRAMWLDRVGESMPLFKRGAGAFIAYAGFAALGCLGAALAMRSSQGEARLRWITMLTLALTAGALMLLVSRTGAVSHAFAAAGAAFLGSRLLHHARAIGLMPVRVVATAFAIAAATPALLLPALKLDLPPGGIQRVCDGDYTSLNNLQPSLLYAPLDIGPRMVVRTPHSVIATGHHRNHAAMREVIATFTGTAEFAHTNIARRQARYVVLCANAPEIENYMALAPQGFAAQLVSGRTPPWLQPLDTAPAASGLLVFAVQERPGTRDGLRDRFALDAESASDS